MTAHVRADGPRSISKRRSAGFRVVYGIEDYFDCAVAMLVARPVVAGLALHAAKLHMDRVASGNVRVRGAVRRDAMAVVALACAGDRGVALRAGRTALRNAPQVRAVAEDVRAACRAVGVHIKPVVCARIALPCGRVDAGGAPHMAARAGGAARSYASKLGPMAILVGAGGCPV